MTGPASGDATAGRDLLLVGAGHAHLYVVRHAAALAEAGYRVRLLAPRWFHYSGLASVIAAGDTPPEEGRIDVAALARRAAVAHHDGLLASLHHERRVALADDGTELAYDVLSLNLGSVVEPPPSMEVGPGVLRVKPLDSLATLGERVDAAARTRGSGATVTVVGAGNSGLELAGHLAVRPGVGLVRLIEARPELGNDLPPGARRRLRRVLAQRGVEVRTGEAVRSLTAEVVRTADGTERAHDVAVLATGLAAPPLLAELGLGAAGGTPVRATLQHQPEDDVYAVGDCARFLPRPLPAVGVHGVRQGPVLHRSLLARAAGEALPTYRPQRRTLAILDLGGTGLAVRGRLWWEGPSALRFKRWIDRRWLAGYRSGA